MKRQILFLLLGILLVIAMINLTTAYPYATNNNAHGVTFDSNSAAGSGETNGLKIIANKNIGIISVTKHPSDTAPNVSICSDATCSGAYLAYATFSGNTATFSTPYNVTGGTSVFVVTEQSSYTRYYSGSASPPYASIDLNFTAGVLNNAEYPQYFCDFISLNTTNYTSTSPAYSNITITAKSVFNNATINTFSVAGNYTGSTSAGSIITTKYANGTSYTFTLSATGFSDLTQIKNDTYIGYMSPLGFGTITAGINYTSALVGNNITLNCSFSDLMGYANETRYFIRNVDDNITYNQTSNIYTLKGTDLQDEINVGCRINNTFYKDYSSTNVTFSGADEVVTFRVINYLGNLIASTLLNFTTLGKSYTGNPSTDFMSSFLNTTQNNATLTINLTDLTYYNQNYYGGINITETQNEYNISLEPNKLVLDFYNGGTSVNTEGEISDIEKVMRFQNTSLVVIQQDLEEGYVKAVFNMQSWTNWTQFYEYKNDFETHIAEQIEILNNTDTYAYFKVSDKGNSPIKDAIIRAEFNTPILGSWTNYTLIGQRLTGDDGTTFFWFDSNTYVLITVLADGYLPQEMLLRIGDEQATGKTLSIPIHLEESSTGVEDGIWAYLPSQVENKSTDIKGVIYAKGKDKVEITTTYREGLGLSNRTLTGDNYDRYYFTLISGTDFASIGNDAIVVKIYVDGTLYATRTIDVNNLRTDILNWSGLDNALVRIFGFIALIIICSIVGYTFNSISAGFTTFMIGIIPLGLVADGLGWLTLIGVIYFVARGIMKIFKE